MAFALNRIPTPQSNMCLAGVLWFSSKHVLLMLGKARSVWGGVAKVRDDSPTVGKGVSVWTQRGGKRWEMSSFLSSGADRDF